MQKVTVQGKTYISSKRAAELCAYAQDYVGQLARKGLIDAQRVGGFWYVFLESLEKYKAEAETYKPQPPRYQPDPSVESIVTFEGKQYLSSSRAAKTTGYNQDYIGQLARGGAIASRQIGNRWYVEHDALLAHKSEKDRLLAAVQAESVGLKREFIPTDKEKVHFPESFFSYTADARHLLPPMSDNDIHEMHQPALTQTVHAIPIRKMGESSPSQTQKMSFASSVTYSGREPAEKTLGAAVFAGGALTIVIVVAVGVLSFLRSDAIYAGLQSVSTSSMQASAISATDLIADRLEDMLGLVLVYKRSQ